MPDIFAPPKNPKSLLLPASRTTSCQTKLPEDCDYQPESLIKLFLLPNVMCLGRRKRKCSGETTRQQYDDYEHAESWGNDNEYDGPFDNGNDQNDAEDTNSLISQPRQVNKIEVQHDKASKQVDVQVLKETLWECLQEPPIQDEEHEQEPLESRSFKELLAAFPDDCQAAGKTQDISPPLCFICLLHLANEHNLSLVVDDRASMIQMAAEALRQHLKESTPMTLQLKELGSLLRDYQRLVTRKLQMGIWWIWKAWT